MNNNRFAQNLRSRIALFLVVSFLVFIASPPSLVIGANVSAGPAVGFQAPTEFIRRIPLTTNDLVYSSSTGKIYASVPSSAGSRGNSITTIDPATGVVGNSTFIGSEPNKLALADDGHNLYVALDGSFAVRRFNVSINTPGVQFALGQDSFSGRLTARDFAVAPGDPDLLAVAQAFSNFGSPAGVAVFDNGVRRPNVQ